MKTVFRIFIPCFCAMLLSASSCENQVKTETKDEISDIESETRAIVTTKFLDDGCEVLLEIQENGEKVMLMPIELEDQYKIDGRELLIKFHSSRIMQSSCQIGRPIVIENVRFVD